MKKILKSRIFTFVLGLIVMASIVGVYAINANEITYKDTTVEEAIDDLYDKTRPTLLWTNPTPTSSFAAQTISIDLSEYKYVVVVTKSTIDNDWLPRSSAVIPILDSQEYAVRIGMTGGSFTREIVATPTGIEFSNSILPNESVTWTVIPYKIYGIKADLGLDLGIDE